jgi:hypothetical protein
MFFWRKYMMVLSNETLVYLQAIVRVVFNISETIHFDKKSGHYTVSGMRIRLIGNDLNTRCPCMYYGCPNLRAQRSYLRIGDTIHEADFCTQHAKEFHGKKDVENFRWR